MGHRSRHSHHHSSSSSSRRKRHRSHSPSRSPSPSPSRDKISKEERARLKEEQRREKEMAKLLETPEEKMKRRREKKLKKHGYVASTSTTSMLGYTNESNPFGDSRLTEKFEWKKKTEVEEKKGVGHSSGDDKRRRERLKIEIQKARERRLEREKERLEWEAEKERLARESELADHEGWEEEEEKFQLEQEKIRSSIRVEQGTAKPIDVLAKLLDGDLSVPLMTMEPYRIVDGCTLAEMNDLMRDIQVKMVLGTHTEVWEALEVVVSDAIAREKSGKSSTGLGNVHGSVRSEVSSMFADKSIADLDELADSIRLTLDKGDAVDADYWADVLAQLKVYRSKALLDETHKIMLETRLSKLEKGEIDEKAEKQAYDAITGAGSASRSRSRGRGGEEGQDDDVGIDVGQTVIPPEVLEASDGDIEIDSDVEDMISSEEKLQKMKQSAVRSMNNHGVDDDEQEATFIESVQLGGKVYKWSDRYRPRQPKYFNRIATGFEWNKYNTSHYDHDNPPPRVVQGYKFNIFYPDLIDKTKLPRYYIDPCPGTDEFVILRFHAGAPYEDVAFKIINRQWQMGSHSGFKSEFKNKILTLYFRFKRYRYRR